MARGFTVCAVFGFGLVLAVGCNNAPTEPAAASTAQTSTTTAPAALKLGQSIEASAQSAKLADIAKEPRKFDKATITTTGTVTAVCQHRGCWMEIKDDGNTGAEAHIRMSGHAFGVPRTAAGKKAKVLAQVQLSPEEQSCADDEAEGMMSTASGPTAPGAKKDGQKKGCRAEAEEQMGHPLPKLELVALGVEIYG